MSERDEAYEKERKEFIEACRRLPPPVSCFSDGAACPWCGAVHATVTFGMNRCRECERPFCFGYPDWHNSKDPVSWVPFPHKEFDACGRKAAALAPWQPNERLQHHYFQKSEEELRVYADSSNPN